LAKRKLDSIGFINAHSGIANDPERVKRMKSKSSVLIRVFRFPVQNLVFLELPRNCRGSESNPKSNRASATGMKAHWGGCGGRWRRFRGWGAGGGVRLQPLLQQNLQPALEEGGCATKERPTYSHLSLDAVLS
jgi:hypothetical protein